MKLVSIILFCLLVHSSSAQIDPVLLRDPSSDSSGLKMNLDAVYARPFIQVGRLPVSLGGYVEANYKYAATDGINEGHQFQFRRLTLFVASTISNRLKFLTEIELEEGGKEINIEFASVDLEIVPLFNFRGGIIMNPIGAFNQNHDGPKWEFVERPLSATQLLPATFSNVGFGIFGKKTKGNGAFAYEAYLTNGFDESIIDNANNKTYLPATKENAERFEESFNGSMLFTGKVAFKHRKIGEIGLSAMSGVYNKFKEDGIDLDRKRRINVFAIDLNTTIPRLKTFINSEFAWINIDLPESYTEQFGSKQYGGFIDIVQPVYSKPFAGFNKSVFNVSLRMEYVDWNKGIFTSTGSNIGDDIFSITPAISWRPTPETVFRFNYSYSRQHDLLGNPPAKTGAFLFGLSTYF